MQVLMLAWSAGADRDGVPPQAHGLAAALAAAGHDVRLLTRAGPDGTAPPIDGVDVQPVADAPPIVPEALRDPLLSALAFASRAIAVGVRQVRSRRPDVVHAEGWASGPVVAGLRDLADLPVLAVLDRSEVTSRATAEVAAALADAAAVRFERRPTVGTGTYLPPGVRAPERRPGPPPAAGPILLVPPRGASRWHAAAELRSRLARRRRISRTWGRRPFAVVVLDPEDHESVVRGFACGVPVLAAPGPAGDLVRAAGAGEVVAGGVPPAAEAIDRLTADPAVAAAFGAAAADAATDHDWSQVATVWGAAAEQARVRHGGPHLLARSD